MPALRTATPEQLEAELRAQLARESASVDYWSPALQAVGLLPRATGGTAGALDEAAIDAFLANVAAYYDPRVQRITVIDRGAPADALESNFLLSHEYVHALQDLDVGLEAFWARWVTSTDSNTATNTLLEGEATVLGTVVLAESLGQPATSIDWTGYVDRILSSIFESAEQSDAPLLIAIQGLPYPVGTDFVSNAWLAGGNANVALLYDEPYVALLDWAEGYSTERRPTLAEPLDCYPTAAPVGFVPEDDDTLGMAGTFALLLTLGEPASAAWSASFGWRGDSMVVFRQDVDPPDASRVAVAWRIRWASAEEAQAFEAAVRNGLVVSGMTAVIDREVLIYAATDPETLSVWADAMRCGTAGELPPDATESPMMQASRRLRALPAPFGL